MFYILRYKFRGISELFYVILIVTLLEFLTMKCSGFAVLPPEESSSQVTKALKLYAVIRYHRILPIRFLSYNIVDLDFDILLYVYSQTLIFAYKIFPTSFLQCSGSARIRYFWAFRIR